MKRYFFIVFFIGLVGNFSAQTINDLEGTWTGSYICNDGKVGLRLKINIISEKDFSGTMEFYPINSLKNRGRIEVGKYNFVGLFNSSEDIHFNFSSWVFKPEGWGYVDKEGRFKGKNKLTGKMLSPTCENFNVKKVK
jgi:hypothetical protein